MIELEERTVIQAPMERCFDLARSVDVHVKGNIHYREQAIALGGVTSGLIQLGQQVTWRAKHFGVWQNLTSEITEFQRPHYFRDTMRQGIFQSMQHDHYFHRTPSGATEMRDAFRFAAPIPLLGRLAEALVLRRYMFNLLHERNQVIKQVAESSEWSQYLQTCE